MSPTLTTAIDALVTVFSWPNILYPVGGTLLAMIVSILPGISGVALMAVVIPLTFFWDPLQIVLLFGALVGGATFMGSITAILLNVPGRTSNAATALDGYPLSQQGKAKTAIAASATASALGSTFGVGILILLMPVMIPVARAFGPLDITMAIVFGLTTIAFVIQGSWLKGLIIAGFGMLLSFIGADPLSEDPRFTFSLTYLEDGLSPILIFLGLFAVAEMMQLASSRQHTISGQKSTTDLSGSIREGIQSVFIHFGLFIRSSVIGTLIGMMPGVGSVVSSFVAYGHAVQSARDKQQFGKGDIRGVIAPEAANDAKDGGALVPTLAIGLPGGMGTAMLLAALTVHGITPGPTLLTQNSDLVFVLIWSLFLSNWLTSILGLAGISWFAKITTVPNSYLVPIVLLIVSLAAYSFRGYTPDVLVVFIAGVFGYYLKKFDWPRIPFVIAMVLGPYFENMFHVSRQLYGFNRIDIASSPVAMIILGLTILGIMTVFFRRNKHTVPAIHENNSKLFSLLIAVFFAATLLQTIDLSRVERMVPLIVAGISIALLGLHLYLSFISKNTLKNSVCEKTTCAKARRYEYRLISSLFLPGLLTLLLGPQIALPLFLFLYLLIQSKAGTKQLLLSAGLAIGLVTLFIRFGLQRAFDGGLLFQLLGT